jgi:hypothetical protein
MLNIKKTNNLRGETMNKEVKLKKIGDEKIKIITRLDGQIDYFLKVDNTGYLENDWLALPEKEFNQMKERV